MTELNDILPLELGSSFDSLDYEENGGLTAHSIKYLDNELHFDFSIFLGDVEHNETQYWQLQILNYCNSKIDIDNLGGYFKFYSDHFLLWEFTDVSTELYFKKASTNPERLLADIYAIHDSIFDNHIPLEKFINDKSLLTVCKSDTGLFARGPKKILTYYFDCLKKAGKEPYYFGEHIDKKWDGKEWIPKNNSLKLALLGRTYFIGETFLFKRL
jgi:hypothetical protein